MTEAAREDRAPVPNNLPAAVSRFIGRDAEIAELADLLGRERLVTITGSGGVGKTRMAQQVAAHVIEQFPDGVWWVELAPITQPADVALTTGLAMGLRDTGIGDPAAPLLDHVGDTLTLIAIDNCEHVVGAVAELAHRLLVSCPNLHVLATSRSPLEVPGETSWRVPSLSLPPARLIASTETLAHYDAPQLFIDRARRARSSFVADDQNVSAIAEICHRLDGIPLAIELAAARCRAFDPQRILDGLADALPLLSHGARTVLPRHRTLESSIDWSHDLLAESERIVLRRLTVFAGSFTLVAAQAVVVTDVDDAVVDRAVVADGLESLVAHSLVELDDRHGETRYRVLETVRQYGRRRLEAVGEAAAIERRHRDFYLARVDELYERFAARHRIGLVIALDRDQDEVRAAIERAADDGEWDMFGRAVWTLSLEWASTGMMRECIRWLTRYLEAAKEDSVTRARVLYARGLALTGVGDLPPAAGDLQAALAMGRAVDDDLAAGRAASALGFLLALADPAAAGDICAEAAERLTRIGDVFGVCRNDANRALALQARAQFAAADELLRRADEVAGGLHPGLRGWVWLLQALGELRRGDTVTPLLRCERTAEVMYLDVVEFRMVSAYVRAVAMIQRNEPSGWVDELPQRVAEADAGGLGLGSLLLSLALGLRQHAAGSFDEAVAVLDDVADRSTRWGVTFLAASGRLDGADAAHAAGDAAGAWQRIEQAQPFLARLGNPQLEAQAARRRAALLLDAGDPLAAERLARQALAIAVDLDDMYGLVSTIDLVTSLEGARQRWDDVARIDGIGTRLRDERGIRLRLEPDRGRLRRALVDAGHELGDERFAAAHADGAAMRFDDAIAHLQQVGGGGRRPSHGWDALSPTERQVADLIREGLTNPQIAARLYISRETVKSHTSHILTKLGVSSRTQIATEVERRR